MPAADGAALAIARASRSVAAASAPETMTAASRPKGGNSARSRIAISWARNPSLSPPARACISG